MGYFEQPDEYQPPEEIWGHDEKLGEWFEDVKYRIRHPDEQVEVPIDDGEDNDLITQLGLRS